MTETWTWAQVREWAENYRGDAAGYVAALLKSADAGSTSAWQGLADIYLRAGRKV